MQRKKVAQTGLFVFSPEIPRLPKASELPVKPLACSWQPGMSIELVRDQKPGWKVKEPVVTWMFAFTLQKPLDISKYPGVQ